MTGPDEKKVQVENSKSLSAPSSPPKVSDVSKDKGAYRLDRQLPNHKNPSYRPHGTLHSVGIESGFDPKAPPKPKKKKSKV